MPIYEILLIAACIGIVILFSFLKAKLKHPNDFYLKAFGIIGLMLMVWVISDNKGVGIIPKSIFTAIILIDFSFSVKVFLQEIKKSKAQD